MFFWDPQDILCFDTIITTGPSQKVLSVEDGKILTKKSESKGVSQREKARFSLLWYYQDWYHQDP